MTPPLPDPSRATSFDRFVEEQERRDPTLRERVEEIKREFRDDGPDCPGCGAPSGFPPAGPCDNHGTAEAVARS